jgi:hypothetical protein
MSDDNLVILFPEPLHPQPLLARVDEAVDSFSVTAQGNGSFVGLAYTVPAHSTGNVSASIQTPCLTSANVADLNDFIRGMVSASQWEKVTDYQKTHASSNLSFFGMLSGGGGASYDKTHEEMRGFGLNEDQISEIIKQMSAMAAAMSSVTLDLTINNSMNDYSVSGSLMLYTIAGSISSGNTQSQYRMLADKGTAGSGSATAPTSADIIPLN